MGGEKNIFYFRHADEIPFKIDDICSMIYLIEERFSQYIKIIHIYDFVNEEHWLPVPPQEYPAPLPIAELEIIKTFKEFSKAFKAHLLSTEGSPKSISHESSKYDPKTATLIIGNESIQLPFDSLESKLVEILSDHKVNEYVDWSIIDEIIKGKDSFVKSDKKSIDDAKRRVNKKVKDAFMTTEKFISGSHNGVCRNI